MSEIVFSHKLFNPLFWHMRAAMRDENIRYIFNRGGSSSGKSVSTAQALVVSVFAGDGSVLVLRKVGTSVKNTVYEEFKKQIYKLKLNSFFDFKENCISCNGKKIDFSGLDDPEKIKSITGYKWIVLEESTEFEYEDFTQIRFRLRGERGLQIICNFNPISEDSWIKTKILDTYEWDDASLDMYGKVRNPITRTILSKEYSTITGKRICRPKLLLNEQTGEMEEYKPDTIELHSTYKNNFWVSGSPDGAYGYYDRQTIANYQWYKDHDYNFYRVYALGEWGSIKAGGEFLHAFDTNKHIKSSRYNKALPIHISIDNNVLPYISVAFYQVDGTNARQIHEICAEEPNNTVTRAAKLAVDYLKSIKYKDVIFLYGDSSTKNGNTIDEEKRSFLDKFVEILEISYHVTQRIPQSNPSVSMSGEFVNHILQDGCLISFSVDDSCRHSITDYNNAKKDVNGGMLKLRVKNKATGQSYEKYGHLTDCLRYFFCEAFKDQYIKFSNKRKRNEYKDDDMKYYNTIPPSQAKIMFCLPELNGKFIAFCVHVSNAYYISDVIFRDGYDDLREYIKKINPDYSIFECEKPYFMFVRELREEFGDIRAYLPKPKGILRISAHMDNIKSKFMLKGDYDEDADYSDFIDNILDYNGKDSYESLYALSIASTHMVSNFSVNTL